MLVKVKGREVILRSGGQTKSFVLPSLTQRVRFLNMLSDMKSRGFCRSVESGCEIWDPECAVWVRSYLHQVELVSNKHRFSEAFSRLIDDLHVAV